jgi:hypothetical protein
MIGYTLLAYTVVVAIPADWFLTPLPLETFRTFHHEAKVFAYSETGTAMTFPVRPGGGVRWP